MAAVLDAVDATVDGGPSTFEPGGVCGDRGAMCSCGSNRSLDFTGSPRRCLRIRAVEVQLDEVGTVPKLPLDCLN